MKQNQLLPIGTQTLLECLEFENHDFDNDGCCLNCGYECEHWDLEGTYCLDCGADLTSDLAAKAYDYYKGLRDD